MTERITTLNWFLPRSFEYLKPLFQLLQKGMNFDWSRSCDESLNKVQLHLSKTLVLAKPKPGEPPIHISCYRRFSGQVVLVREERKTQQPIYYTSKSLADAQTRYNIMEKYVIASIILLEVKTLLPSSSDQNYIILSDQSHTTQT